jgi:hypothetical protein
MAYADGQIDAVIAACISPLPQLHRQLDFWMRFLQRG